MTKISHEAFAYARFTLLLLLCLIQALAWAQFSPSVSLAPLADEAQKPFKRTGLPESAIGVAVLPLPPTAAMGPVLSGFGLNADAAFNPASTMKLVTTRAALGLLGADYRHHTRIATTGILTAGTLKGDLFFQGGGDPKLVMEDLQEIVARLRAIGIDHIDGRVVIDGTRYAEPEIDSGAFDQKPLKPYNVGPHAAMVNFKAMKVSVWPEDRRHVHVATEPSLPADQIKIRVALVDGDCSRTGVTARMEDESRLLVSGVMGKRCPGADFYVSVMDHARFAFTAFKGAWEAAGGTMRAKLQSGVTPGYARTLVQWESPRPLIELITDINKMSNNPMTRQVFLNLSARGNTPATRDASTQVIKDYLASRGLDFPELVLDNGSGLSRRERISALSLVRLLTDAMLAPDANSWLATLPMVGIEGTVKNRLRNSMVEGRAWLKTGALEDVRAYAGYVRSAQDRWVVVAVIVNHPEAHRARPAMDEFIKWVYAYF